MDTRHWGSILFAPPRLVENIEVDQGYFMDGINHVDKRHFDKDLVNITLCGPARFAFAHTDTAFYALHLHSTYGFQWDIEVVGEDLEF